MPDGAAAWQLISKWRLSYSQPLFWSPDVRLLFFIFYLTSLHANQNYYLVTANNHGFFHNFCVVLGYLNFYENNPCNGLEICFNNGYYYDPIHKGNWWEYYFEPIKLGSKLNSTIYTPNPPEKRIFAEEAFHFDRKMAHDLIERHIRVKPFVTKKVNKFYNSKMKNHFNIGIHYRGTDKVSEVPQVTYAQMLDRIRDILGIYKQDVRLFVATDEQGFLKEMIREFGDRVVYLDNYRSKNKQPIHIDSKQAPFQMGLEALLDCLLLSKCDILIRTTYSNVSQTALFFNCDQEDIVIEISV